MDKDFTILHISDLHKSEEDSYDDLFESLRLDSESYDQEGIIKPEIIVVSGDIVEGAEGDNADAIIVKQYADAKGFLMKLVDFFLDGDRTRLIMVPGNHDVCRGISKEAFLPSINKKEDDLETYRKGGGELRWSWKDFCFYKISDKVKYETRFVHFVHFYNDFYEGKRIIEQDCALHGKVIEIPDYNIAFLTLNSCHNLDHLNNSGSIYTGAVSENGIKLSNLDKKGYLLCAVWHHHVSGLPTEHNYLDYRILSSLMRYNIQMGLFGHQHKSKVVQRYSDVTEEKEMFLISAGSLYGNLKQLPADTSRQYNLIGIKIHGQEVEVTVRTRKDQSEGLYKIPRWGHAKIGNSNRDFVTKTLGLTQPAPVPSDEIINEINERTRKTGDYKQGILELVPYRSDNPIVERYIDDYIDCLKPEDCYYVMETLGELRSEKQAMYLLGSAKARRDKGFLEQLKQIEYIKNHDSSMVGILRDE